MKLFSSIQNTLNENSSIITYKITKQYFVQSICFLLLEIIMNKMVMLFTQVDQIRRVLR